MIHFDLTKTKRDKTGACKESLQARECFSYLCLFDNVDVNGRMIARIENIGITDDAVTENAFRAVHKENVIERMIFIVLGLPCHLPSSPKTGSP